MFNPSVLNILLLYSLSLILFVFSLLNWHLHSWTLCESEQLMHCPRNYDSSKHIRDAHCYITAVKQRQMFKSSVIDLATKRVQWFL